jgi:hypothetical protein
MWIKVVVLCDYKQDVRIPALRIFNAEEHPELYTFLDSGTQRKDCPRWTEIKAVEPKAEGFTEAIGMTAQGRYYLLRIRVTSKSLNKWASDVMYRAKLSCKRLRLGGQDDADADADDLNFMSDSSSGSSTRSHTRSSSSSDSSGGCLLDR